MNTLLLKRLYTIESRKLFPYRAFKLMLLLFAVLFVMSVLFFSTILFDNFFARKLTEEISSATLQTNIAWNIVTYFAGFFNAFLSYAIMMYVCNEYSYRTLRQNVIDGLSRTETLVGKYLIAIVIALAATVLVAIMSTYFQFGASSIVQMPLGLEYLGLYFLQLVSTLIVAIFFSTWMRKTGLAVLLFAACWYIIDALLYYWILPAPVAQILPFSAIKDLVHIPGLDEAVSRGGLVNEYEKEAMSKLHLNANYLLTIAKVLAWDALFVFITLRMVRQRDI